MAVKIRLARYGAKKKPFYRVVVADSQAKRDGRFIEILGTYDPNQNPAQVNIQRDKLQSWLDKGAEPTDTVASLIRGLPSA
jgi:small subunit ribosomal protein S16